MARWERKGAEGNEWEGGLCKSCDKKVVETVRHLLIECEAYRDVREVWWKRVEEVVRKVLGWVEADPLKLMFMAKS